MQIFKKTWVPAHEESDLHDVLCNWCGESCKSDYDYEGLPETRIRGGYGSKHLGDMNEVSFAICEACLVQRLFPQFKIPVKVDDLNSPSGG